MFTISSEFAARRKKLMQTMGKNAIAIIASSPERTRSNDTEYTYRQDSDFYYLTGFSEPEAIAVLVPGRAKGEYILFNRTRDPAKETWYGRRAGQEGVLAHYNVDEAHPISEFSSKLAELLLDREKVCYAIGHNVELDKQITGTINMLRSKVRQGVVAPHEFINLDQWLHEMRLFKSPAEVELMRKAAKISTQAHIRLMQMCKPGLYEYELEAELLHEFFRHGSRAPAYNSIIGGGENACILHYVENNAQLKSGDLVLVDAGCEYEYYASDITRVFPVNGKFSAEQKVIYEIVLAAQQAALDQAKPGSTLDKVNDAAARVITEGLVDVGILKGEVNSLIEQKAYLPFYMHRPSHWIGLDTHDMGNYKINGEWRKLEPGMTHTVEPGIYISASIPNVDKKWHSIGVRIEDDVLITEKGHENLTIAAPKKIADIEALMAGK
jgi:Xaa-Pro aminopeptidase